MFHESRRRHRLLPAARPSLRLAAPGGPPTRTDIWNSCSAMWPEAGTATLRKALGVLGLAAGYKAPEHLPVSVSRARGDDRRWGSPVGCVNWSCLQIGCFLLCGRIYAPHTSRCGVRRSRSDRAARSQRSVGHGLELPQLLGRVGWTAGRTVPLEVCATLTGLRMEFADFVLEQLPDSAARVLEVGCGSEGGIARALAAAGYDVLAIDPMPPTGRCTGRSRWRSWTSPVPSTPPWPAACCTTFTLWVQLWTNSPVWLRC